MVVDVWPKPAERSRREPRRATGKEIVVSYVLGFLGALVVEFIALFPLLATIGSHMKPGTPAAVQISRYLTVTHLPTLGLTWLLSGTMLFPDDLTFFTPLTQIVFWTFVLAFALRYWLTRRTPKLP